MIKGNKLVPPLHGPLITRRIPFFFVQYTLFRIRDFKFWWLCDLDNAFSWRRIKKEKSRLSRLLAQFIWRSFSRNDSPLLRLFSWHTAYIQNIILYNLTRHDIFFIYKFSFVNKKYIQRIFIKKPKIKILLKQLCYLGKFKNSQRKNSCKWNICWL